MVWIERVRAVLAAAMFIAITVGVQAQQVVHDVPYTQRGGGQSGDLYKPAGAGAPAAAIVYIHGGSWRSGSKDVYRKLATDLAAQGYAGFAINYNLKPHSYPLSWEQARDAVRFVRAHAAEYNIDPARIYVAGDSAGGQLAALVALAPEGPASAGETQDVSAAVAGALIFNGVFDLHNTAGVITRYLGVRCTATATTALCSDASPEYHVHAGAPPFFVGHGTRDGLVPYSEAVRFDAALRAAKVPVTPYAAEGGPHSYWRKSKYYAANLVAVEAFLKAQQP